MPKKPSLPDSVQPVTPQVVQHSIEGTWYLVDGVHCLVNQAGWIGFYNRAEPMKVVEQVMSVDRYSGLPIYYRLDNGLLLKLALTSRKDILQ